MLNWITFRRVLCLSIAIRIGLIAYGYWQDNNSMGEGNSTCTQTAGTNSTNDDIFYLLFYFFAVALKYTDIDYEVFTDGARYVSEGSSPYSRVTYRYTPLLAIAMVPNVLLSKLFGKLCFSFCDLLVGILLHSLLCKMENDRNENENDHDHDRKEKEKENDHNDKRNDGKENRRVTIWVACAWLLNPIVFNVSSRGNAESLVAAMVVLTLYCLYSNRIVSAALCYGLSVHFKIYPIIYALAFALWLDDDVARRAGRSFWSVARLLNRRRLVFALCSAATFVALGVAMYALYGYEFVDQTYLYHVYRKDHRHNFSVYFYQLYLQSVGSSSSSSLASSLLGIASFVPQLAVIPCVSVRYANRRELPLGLLLLTLLFVAFNKVCTVQYFVWYFALLPLALPTCGHISARRALLLLAAWFGSQLLWLYFGYGLEFKGDNTFLSLWVAGLLFFVANIAIVIQLVVVADRQTAAQNNAKHE
jgi:GPI mannosyltransferase 1 subunit M